MASREITQRELRNESGEIMRQLDRGDRFVVTRNGVPVGELAPLRRHRFVSAEAAVAAFKNAPAVDLVRLRHDLDRVAGQDRSPVVERPRPPRGVIDTSVVVDLENLEATRLPSELAVSALTMAELAAGPHAAGDAVERARRQDRLQRAEAVFDPLPFDIDAARAYGRVYAATVSAGRQARGRRAVDLLIAATALAHGLPLVTRHHDDFACLEGLVEVIRV